MINTILVKPIITEKSINRTRVKFYTFEVSRKASKHQIKQAVEKLFSVDVETVRTINRTGKIRHSGRARTESKTNDRRIAMVKIGKDQTIDLFSIVPEQTK